MAWEEVLSLFGALSLPLSATWVSREEARALSSSAQSWSSFSLVAISRSFSAISSGVMAAEEGGGGRDTRVLGFWNRAALIPCNNAKLGLLDARLEIDPSNIYTRVHVDDLVSKSGYRIGVQENNSSS